MLPYFFMLFIPAVLPFLIYQPAMRKLSADYGYIRQRQNKMTVFLFFTIFFILLALRDITVGRDLFSYGYIHRICINTSFDNLSTLRWEFGYVFYDKLISLISQNYRFFLVITALITLIPIWRLYSKEKKYGLLTILIFLNMPCFLIIFSGLRQAMAVSIGCIAYMCIEKRKYILGVLLIFLASSFHISALVLLLIYPAYFLNIKTRHLLYILPMMIAVYFLRVPLLSFFINYMPEKYIDAYGEIQQTGAIGMLILFLIFLVFSFVILDEEAMSKKDYFMRNILLIAAVFQFFVPIHGLIQRASYFFMIFVPISIVSVVEAPKRKLKNISDISVVVMTCFFAVYFFFNAVFSTDNLLSVFPYKFFWSGQ